MITQRDILDWKGEPILIECLEGPDDPRACPRRAYMLAFEPPEAFKAQLREQMIEHGRAYIEAVVESGAELADGVDPDNLDEYVAEFVGQHVEVEHLGVAEPFELCFN